MCFYFSFHFHLSIQKYIFNLNIGPFISSFLNHSLLTQCSWTPISLTQILFWKALPDMFFPLIDSKLTVVHRTHWKLEVAWEAGASLFCYRPTQHRWTENKARPQPHVDLLSRHGMQVGRDWPFDTELADSSCFKSPLRATTLWLSSMMCSSDSCSLEIRGLGKHVCYADSRTTNFTRLTSRPSVRLCN